MGLPVVSQFEIVFERPWVEHAFRRAVETLLHPSASAAEGRGRFTSGAKAHAHPSLRKCTPQGVLHPARHAVEFQLRHHGGSLIDISRHPAYPRLTRLCVFAGRGTSNLYAL